MLTGSGRALRLLELGQADVVISHAPEAEAAYRARHADWRYRKYAIHDVAGGRGGPASARRVSDRPQHGAPISSMACGRSARPAVGDALVTRPHAQSCRTTLTRELWIVMSPL
jgi:hypothetical protein